MDFANYYHTRIKSSLDDDRASIIDGFRDIIKRGARPNFRLVNYYKGLPISYPAAIVEMERGILDLDVHQQQAVAIDRARRVFIKCDYFDSAIVAEVQNVDVRRRTAALRNFTFVEIMAERRDALRLELEQPTEAEINGDAGKLTGRLFDISLGGVSIRTERCPFGKGTEVQLRVMIPNLLQNTLSSLEVRACHVETTRDGQGDICRFSFEGNAHTETAISRFIFQRQVEIIKEIKDAS